MPTVPQLKAELKQLGVKGYSKKLKGELIYMLVAFKKANAKEEVKKPEPVKIAIKDIREKRPKPKIGKSWAEKDEESKKDAEEAAKKAAKKASDIEDEKHTEYLWGEGSDERIAKRDAEIREQNMHIMGGEKSDGWITNDFIYDLAHNNYIKKTEDLYYVKVLKEKIEKWEETRWKYIKTLRQRRIVGQIDQALKSMLKDNGKKHTIPIQTVRNTVQPFIGWAVQF